jgi:hypothetical protein
MTRATAITAFALVLFACEEPSTTQSVPSTTGDARPVDLGIGPDRPRRRMDIDQLDASIRRATGGIGWDDSTGRSQLAQFSVTLGVPDYVTTTSEDLEVSTLFLKFLDDAARSTCDQLLAREIDSAPENRTFLVHADVNAAMPDDVARINENLAYLLLRFHGRRVSPDSNELARWRELFAMSREASVDEPTVAWRTICIALIDHPDFFLY